MLTMEMRDERRPPAGARESDAPLALRSLADVEKGMAVAAGLTHMAGQAFEAEVESVRYGAFDRMQEFRKPAELRVWVRSGDGKGCECLQALPDTDFEAGIARSLGKAAGEDYRVRVAEKLYRVAPTAPGEMRLTVLVGRA